MKRVFVFVSIALNILFFALVIRHFILKPVIKVSTGISYWLHRDELLNGLKIDSGSIVFAGDSHIENFEVTEIFNSLNVKNRGINYDTSAGLLNRLNSLTMSNPKKIFIEIGTNDINNGVASDSTIRNLSQSIYLIKRTSPKTLIYLHSIIPFSGNEVIRVDLNRRISALCKSENINFIDLDPVLISAGNKLKYSSDGTHLTSTGYSLWAKTISPLIK